MNFYEQEIGQAKEQSVPTQDQTPLYLYPASYARGHWELEEYRASRRSCLAYKDAIEAAISEYYYNNRLNPGAVAEVLQHYRPEQVNYVLACTIQHKDWDTRFSADNKRWAKTITTHKDRGSYGNDNTLQFVIDRPHPGIVGLFITQARKDLEKSKPSIQERLMQTISCSAKIMVSLQNKPEL